MNRAKLLSLVWNSNLFERGDLEFFPDKDFDVVSRGVAQEGASVDFSAAVLLDTASGKEISGGVRVDAKSSDWRNEQTLGEPQYDNVVLHLVEDHDTQLFNSGKPVLTARLNINPRLAEAASRLAINCTGYFGEMESIERSEVINRLLDERVERKTKEILSILESCQQSWYEALFVAFFRAMGMAGHFKAEFEAVARAVGYQFVSLHSKDFDFMIAYALGRAGLMEDGADEYSAYMNELYAKYTAENGDQGLLVDWQKFRSRPSSFPAVTMVRALAILCRKPMLFDDMLNMDSAEDLKELFRAEIPEYWCTHSSLGKGLSRTENVMSGAKIESIIINFTIPVLFVMAIRTGDEKYAERGILLYETLKSENFSYLSKWKSYNWTPSTAFHSQALVQINDGYCRMGRCFECPLGTRMLQKEWKRITLK